MSRTFWIAAGLAVVLVVGAIAAFFLMRGGVQQGAGAYLPQLRECQDEIFAMAMHPADMAFEDRTVWHEVAGGPPRDRRRAERAERGRSTHRARVRLHLRAGRAPAREPPLTARPGGGKASSHDYLSRKASPPGPTSPRSKPGSKRGLPQLETRLTVRMPGIVAAISAVQATAVVAILRLGGGPPSTGLRAARTLSYSSVHADITDLPCDKIDQVRIGFSSNTNAKL